MNYQPFLDMHILVSDDLLAASIAIANAFMAIVVAFSAITLIYFLFTRI